MIHPTPFYSRFSIALFAPALMLILSLGLAGTPVYAWDFHSKLLHASGFHIQAFHSKAAQQVVQKVARSAAQKVAENTAQKPTENATPIMAVPPVGRGRPAYPAFGAPPPEQDEQADSPMPTTEPSEFQKSIFSVSFFLVEHVFRPIGLIYHHAIPKPIREGLYNFSVNLSEPSNAILALMAGRGDLAARAWTRFSVNSFYGLFGLLDVAKMGGVQSKPFALYDLIGSYTDWRGQYIPLAFYPTDTLGLLTLNFSLFLPRTSTLLLENGYNLQVPHGYILQMNALEGSEKSLIIDKIPQGLDNYDLFYRTLYLPRRDLYHFRSNLVIPPATDEDDFEIFEE